MVVTAVGLSVLLALGGTLPASGATIVFWSGNALPNAWKYSSTGTYKGGTNTTLMAGVTAWIQDGVSSASSSMVVQTTHAATATREQCKWTWAGVTSSLMMECEKKT